MIADFGLRMFALRTPQSALCNSAFLYIFTTSFEANHFALS
jgi:hypothetical protein